MDSAISGTLGNVLPGSLLGPIVGLTFSADGGLLFACSGSSLWVYHVRSGALLSTIRVFMPGVAVYGMDVGRESFGAIFGEKCVRVVDAVPTGAGTNTAAAATASSAWFRDVVHLPDMDDRVWDARLVDSREGQGAGGTEFPSSVLPTGETQRPERVKQAPCQDGESAEDGRRRGRRAGMGLLAVALAHNLVEVWDWAHQARPLRILRARRGDPCLLYHSRLWGRTLEELRVASGTVFNQVLVWNPAKVRPTESQGRLQDPEARGREAGRSVELPERPLNVLRLKGHKGVIFRVAWREDGRRLISASDDRTVRVWDVECHGGGGERSEGEGNGNEGGVCRGRLLWTGWGHASRVWDVGFTRLGVISCGEDGATFLWREKQDIDAAAAVTAEAAAARTASTKSSAARTPISVTPPQARLHGRGEGGQLVPVANMRGHSGVNTWRLAVHEFESRSGGCGSSSSSSSSDDRRVLTLLATGGNDGTCKLWDLEFEGACERRQRQLWGQRGSGTWWGKTEAIPSDPHIIAGPATPDAVLTGDKGAAVGTRESSHPASAAATTHTPLAANAATPPAGRSENYSEGVTAASPGESKGNPPAPGPASNASLPHTPPQHQTASHRTQEEEEEAVEGQEQSRGRASRRRAERQRQNKPAVVREVRLARRSKSGTAVAAAAVLLADGSVWWVPDLQVGTWERVTVSVGDAEVADGVTEEGLLSSAGVSAVAVVGLSPGPSFADKENTVASDRGGESVAKKLGGGGCGVAIVASRDDGWLFLLSRGRPLPSVDSDGGRGDQPSSQLLDWRVSAAWKGHRSRVTAVWAVRDASQSRSPRAPAGGAQVFTAALDTSRLSNLPSSRRRHGVRLDGALVSAGADGTVAWWEWASGEEGPSMVHDGSGCEEMTMSAPKLRMVCQAGPEAAVTSVAIDDRRQPCHFSSKKVKHGGGNSDAPSGASDESEGNKDIPSAGAVVFCGETKGGIQCFLEEKRSSSRVLGARDKEVRAGNRVDDGLMEALQPCLVLKRQHGKHQVSRVALRGNCLFSAGHDGQVNHYVVSYSASSFDMLANAEPHQHSSVAGRGRHASGGHASPSFSETVDLTIVTTYATGPVTTVSELWVGGDENWGAGPRRAAGGSEGRVRVAVAGRSGSSRMSVWDLTEGRQILELACGEKHRAQDLLLSWPAINYSSGCPSSALNQEEDPSTVTMSTTVDGETEDKRGNSIAGEPSFPEPLAALHCRGGVAFPPPPLALPRHTFVFAEPCPTTARKSTSSDNDITEGKAAPVGAAGNSRPENNSGPPPIALVGDVRNRRQKHRQERRQARPGVALAFHSSSLPLVRSEDQPRTPLRREQPRQSRLHAAPEDVADCPAAGPGSAGFASTVTVPESQPIAAAERVTRQADGEDVAAAKDDRKRLSYHAEDVCLGSVEASDGCPVSLVPGRFGYSLGKPFHSQRVAAVKFITPGAPTTRLEAGRSGFSPNLRLITGGEDGAVKLLDVFLDRHRRSSNASSQAATDPPSEAFHRPYAEVVQTLPSHESSVGALAVGLYGCSNGLESTLVVSGGGKMEVRAWRMGGGCGHGGSGEGRPREEAMGAACAPLVRWLATTTPAPKSPLHAHRIMCVCTLPPPPSHPRLPGAHDSCGRTIFVTGDSGGGVSVFELQRDVPANSTAAVGGTESPNSGGGEREERSRPVGRWTTSGERPVLSLAHARVPTSAAPGTAVDFIATGDTGGTVTLWEFLPGRGSGVLAYMDGGHLRQGASGVREGFVYRGPAGKRRGGNGMSAAVGGAAAGESPRRPGLVPVLSYRAHQMGVLCMAVHVPPEGGRVVVVTGGDDQAVCVAEVELRDNSVKPFNLGSPRGGETTSCSNEKISAGKRQLAARLVSGRPEVTQGAAGSAIKGIRVVPVSPPVSAESSPSAKTRVSSGVEEHPATGDGTSRLSIALSVFTISRDQRLSRWDLVEQITSDNCATIGDTAGPHPPESRTRGSGADISSSPCLGREGDRGRQRVDDVGGAACDHSRTPLSHQGNDGMRQRARRDKNEEGRRWRLRWRAGCVTDVADVSDLDVYPLPGDPKQQTVYEGAAFRAKGARPKEVAASEECHGRHATDEAHACPAALVAVSGQGLQLVLFGAY